MKINNYLTFDPELNKQKTQEKTKDILEKVGELQNKMFAQGRYSLLIIFQGMDASGKDGVVFELLKKCNPIGIKIKSFKKPTQEEYSQDFLWRIHKNTPAKGEMQIFIRSHYEDILVPTVEGFLPKDLIDKRYQQINDFELLLEDNNTKVLKFFLNVSYEVQEQRLLERIEQKEKHWKHKDSDWETRKHFKEYLQVYEEIFKRCNKKAWYIIPSDKNWQKIYFVAEKVFETLEKLELEWPKLESELFNK